MNAGEQQSTVVTVHAHVVAAPDSTDHVEQACRSIVDEVLQEDGCLAYYLLRGVDNRRGFAWFEQWRDEHAFQAHLASPHAARLGTALDGHLESPMVLTRYESLL